MPGVIRPSSLLKYEVGELHYSRRNDAARLIQQLINRYFHLADHEESRILEAVSADGSLLGVSIVRYPQERYEADLGSAELEYLAVARPHQKTARIGATLLRHAEDEARHMGMTEMSLWAARTAIPFYERHGYTLLPNPSRTQTPPMAKQLS